MENDIEVTIAPEVVEAVSAEHSEIPVEEASAIEETVQTEEVVA